VNEAINRYSTAKAYFQSAIMIVRNPERNTDSRRVLTLLPLSMLCGFSLELYFKAWLLACGYASHKVRGYGHAIGLLYRDATIERFPAIAGLDQLLIALQTGHEDYTFRYINDGDRVNAVDWEAAFAILNSVDDAVDTRVGASTSRNLAPGH